MEYHVSKNGKDTNTGEKAFPFFTISKAAQKAVAGDCVIVHEGVYREWVKPQNGGLSDSLRITYRTAEGEKALIKGSEEIKTWEKYNGTTWKAKISNELFGDYNPYQKLLEGDWLELPSTYHIHTGEVYINGKALYEAESLEDVIKGEIRQKGITPPWFTNTKTYLHPEDSKYKWIAEVNDGFTTIYANFHEYNPNDELTEINVRRCCFFPEKIGCDYITLEGFEIAQAACPWAPPTAIQYGAVGTNWSKGWIIRKNIIHDAKCSGVSIGKNDIGGDNLCTYTTKKPGYQYQMEAVFKALQIGWRKEKIGSHRICDNVIFDCGQNGVVGHLGCVFSTIENNHIYNIGVKHEYFGHEIAGIKLHTAIDVQLIHNRIHDCTLGTWLDWQAQGTRVSQNLYYKNDRDFMIEVTHGPCLIDNNIFASEYNFDHVAQGTAYVHNLCCGILSRSSVLNRSTPYHFNHTTEVAGCALVYGGDDRWYQNVFVGGSSFANERRNCGTSAYNEYTTSMEEYKQKVIDLGIGDVEKYEKIKQPVYINGNCYLNNAQGFAKEEDKCALQTNPECNIVEKLDGVYLEINLSKEVFAINTEIIDTEKLGMVRITEQAYENPDGSPICICKDLVGEDRGIKPSVGPIQAIKLGYNSIKIWNN